MAILMPRFCDWDAILDDLLSVKAFPTGQEDSRKGFCCRRGIVMVSDTRSSMEHRLSFASLAAYQIWCSGELDCSFDAPRADVEKAERRGRAVGAEIIIPLCHTLRRLQSPTFGWQEAVDFT